MDNNFLWPSYSNEEADKIRKILLSNKVNYWTGTECRDFEAEFASFADSNYAIAVANGTVALDLALNALEIGLGDEVIVTSRTFLASVSSIVNCGAIPIFADVCDNSQNITPKNIEAAISSKTKAILCVHLAGWPCEMTEILEIADKHKILVIEDCAQAHGARYKSRSVGSFGHVSAWSFCQDKIMTTGGEGGMVTTNDESLWRKMWSFKDHGKSYEAVYERDHPAGFRWVHDSFGTNWRMTEMQASIGRIQLQRMSEWTRLRNRNASILSAKFNEFDHDKGLLRIPRLNCGSCDKFGCENFAEGCVHAYYKYYVFIRPDNLADGWSRDRIIEEITSEDIPCLQGSCSEVYLEKAFDGTDFRPDERLAVAKRLGETSLMFLVHPTLLIENINRTADVAAAVFRRAQVGVPSGKVNTKQRTSEEQI
jgi:dTDP-4-amino-4,6-dideoxygalactose transaminase